MGLRGGANRQALGNHHPGIPIAFLYLLVPDYDGIVVGFALQEICATGRMHVRYPAYLSGRSDRSPRDCGRLMLITGDRSGTG